jgi:hypothetical protein
MNNYKKQIAYVLAIFAFLFVVVNMYNKVFNNTLKPGAQNVSARETLKRLSEEGEFYYDSYQHYGIIQTDSSSSSGNLNNSCNVNNTFLAAQPIQDLLNNFSSEEKRCTLRDINGMVDAWMVAIKDGGDIWCGDSKGNTKKMSSWPTGYECE